MSDTWGLTEGQVLIRTESARAAAFESAGAAVDAAIIKKYSKLLQKKWELYLENELRKTYGAPLFEKDPNA